MLDLNIGAEFSVRSCSCEDETDQKTNYNTVDTDSVTSNTNTDAFPAGLTDDFDSNSSIRSYSARTLKFSILNEKVVEIDDEVNNGAAISNRNELPLFPVGAFSSTPVSERAKYWLNLSVPEVSGGGGVELGILAAKFPPPPKCQVQQQAAKKSRRGPRSRSSQYRGVTFCRRTGRWESHIWDCGKQVYLGGFDTAHAAARAYDRAAVKFRGIDADINFSISDYEEDMKQMKNLTKEEFVQILRRQNTGLLPGSSKYRGVTLRKYEQREGRMGHFIGQKDYGKATTGQNLGQCITHLEPRAQKREINVTSIDGGGNFDLNLGISLASNDPQRPDGKKEKVETSSASSLKQIMVAKYAPMDDRKYSGSSPNSKERAMGMSGENTPLSGFTNWPVEVQSHGVPLFSTSAASSGFSSTTTIPYSKLPRLNNIWTG